MIDQYGRTIEYLRISVTDRCNLRCVYCMPEEGIEQLPHEQILTFDEIERVCRISTELGISKIKLTGGEPLVRKGLPDLLGKIKRVSGIEQVTLTTNGILLKNQLDELMRQGLDAVNISIDTLDETCYHTVTRCGELNQALEGLQAALEYPNLRVKLNCVPMNQSEEEYIQMAEYAKEHPLEVRFIEMMPIGMGKACQGKSRRWRPARASFRAARWSSPPAQRLVPWAFPARIRWWARAFTTAPPATAHPIGARP